MSRVGKLIETESQLVVAICWGKGRLRIIISMGFPSEVLKYSGIHGAVRIICEYNENH